MKIKIRNIEIKETTSYGFSNISDEDTMLAFYGLIGTFLFFGIIFGLYNLFSFFC